MQRCRVKNTTRSRRDYSLTICFIAFTVLTLGLYPQFTQATCPAHQYGNSCELTCNCHKCDSNDGCLQEDCYPGWFGEKCLYKNLITKKTKITPKISEYLSCVLEDQITIYLESSIYFVFMQIGFNSIVSHNAVLSVMFDRASANSIDIRNHNNKTLLFESPSALFVQVITVRLSGVLEICWASISQGRNMYFGQKPVFMEKLARKSHPDPGLLVDGSSQSCVHEKSSQGLTWHIQFDPPVAIQLIFLYFDGTIGNGAMDYMLKVNNQENITISESNTIHQIHVPWDKATHQVHITSTSNSFSLCEVEFYGDCDAGTTGTKCDKPCSDRCIGLKCFLDGNCRYGEQENKATEISVKKVHGVEIGTARTELPIAQKGDMWYILLTTVIVVLVLIVAVLLVYVERKCVQLCQK